ncbi:transcription factor bHLH126-like [Nymphaea colorata]|uniref:transcription factor bHLH126-like n=1 Tax=Nymphaea colorata TaxID=210225 RepID=UPI00129EFC42|nr:transcription factor bHLH126-like [Nymphaea colorata]
MEWSDGEGGGGGDERGGGGGGDARERHKLAERERRKSMRELFLCLHSHLPHSQTVRKEQSAILDEIIKYIPLAAARLRTLQSRRDELARSSSSPRGLTHVTDRNNASSLDFDIRVMPDSASSVAVRVRGNRVNVSLTDTKGAAPTMLLSTLLAELEAHQLELVRATHCRDGSRLLHHSECQVVEGLGISTALLKTRLQGLACKVHSLKRSSILNRSFHQID